MKLKYYLRGLGIGIIVSTLVLSVSFCGQDAGAGLSDDEVIARALELGMVMPQEGANDGASTEEGEDMQADPDAGNVDVPSGMDGVQSPEDTPSGTDEAGTPDEGEDDADAGATNAPPADGLYRLVIEPGDVCRVVCEELADNGVIEDAEALRTYLFEIGYASNMSIGAYDVPYGLTNEQVAAVLMAGPIEGTN